MQQQYATAKASAVQSESVVAGLNAEIEALQLQLQRLASERSWELKSENADLKCQVQTLAEEKVQFVLSLSESQQKLTSLQGDLETTKQQLLESQQATTQGLEKISEL